MTHPLYDGPRSPAPDGPRRNGAAEDHARDHALSWWDAWSATVERWLPMVQRYCRTVQEREDRRQNYLLEAWKRTLRLAKRGPIRFDQWGPAIYRAALRTLCLRENPGGLCARRLPGPGRTSSKHSPPTRIPLDVAQAGRDANLRCPAVCYLTDWDAPCRIGRQIDPAARVQMASDWASLVARLPLKMQGAVRLLAFGYSRNEVAQKTGYSVRQLRRVAHALAKHWHALQYGE